MSLLIAAALCVTVLPSPAQGAFKKEVPDFQVRVRIESVEPDGENPLPEVQKWFLAAAGRNFPLSEGDWSDWIVIEDELKAFFVEKTYPNLYLEDYPFVAAFTLHPHKFQRAAIEVEWEVDGQGGTFFGTYVDRSVAFLLWSGEDGGFRIGSSAEFNKRYVARAEALGLTRDDLPQKFVFADRFIGIDSNEEAWLDGLRLLSLIGFNTIQATGFKGGKRVLNEAGVMRTTDAVYTPPLLHDADPELTGDEAMRDWARKQAQRFTDVGWAVDEVALYGIADEPAWYYPRAFRGTWPGQSDEMAASMVKNFRSYLREKGITPADVGKTSWEKVEFLGQSGAVDVPSRRLYYWTMRFFPDNSADTFARATRALEEAFYPGLPTSCNWNLFSGRYYNPGPIANNPDKEHPDAAMGAHDWIDFGRRRAVTSLWTQDWFHDKMASQWSFYASKLRSAADHYNLARGGNDPSPIGFGGYVIGRATGTKPGGALQKMLAVLGHGGKQIKTFVFGPEYAFPRNCWSENESVFSEMAAAMRVIGRAEDLLFPGKPIPAEVAILTPQSAQVWDPRDAGIFDATNTSLNSATVDYMAEVFNAFTALQRLNIPTDFVDEQDLEEKDYLSRFKLLIVTTPNLSVTAVDGLKHWVAAGGTLLALSSTGQSDELDQPSGAMTSLLGIEPSRRARLFTPDHTAPQGGIQPSSDRTLEPFDGRGFAEPIEVTTAKPLARFADNNKPAIVLNDFGKGRALTVGTLPGTAATQGGFSGALGVFRKAVELAGVQPPVRTHVENLETPVLVSDQGMAITLLNWSDQELVDVELRVVPGRPIHKAVSAQLGEIPFRPLPNEVILTLPTLGPADVVKLYFAP